MLDYTPLAIETVEGAESCVIADVNGEPEPVIVEAVSNERILAAPAPVVQRRPLKLFDVYYQDGQDLERCMVANAARRVGAKYCSC